MNSFTSTSDRSAALNATAASRFLLAIVAVACVALATLVLLPHDPYARFAEAASESDNYLRLRWIYERVHYDSTPIDVAFIGTSHTQSAIDSRIVESELKKRGLDLHVVNFAVPHLGRDLHYLLTRELLESRTVRELVVEVQDFEPRAPHPAFQRLARAADLFDAPIIVNTGILENFARLPRRELDLFLPELTGHSRAGFDPAHYDGAHWDDTERLHGFRQLRDGTHTAVYLEEKAGELRSDLASKEALARRLAMPDGCSLLKRYNRIYLEKILALAREKDVHVTFLYLPFFRGPQEPIEARYYRFHGLTITPHAALDDPASWLNVDHVNVAGARKVSRWVGESLSVTREATPSTGDAPCY